MGRKAKPAHLHLLDKKKHFSKAELDARLETEKSITPSKDKIKPPSWLDKAAKKEFKRLADELAQLDLITNVDVNALATYCDAYSEYLECTKIIQEEGLLVEYTNKGSETTKVRHPLMMRKKQLHEQMKSLAIEFGLSPASRARLAMPKQEEKPKTEEEILFGDAL